MTTKSPNKPAIGKTGPTKQPKEHGSKGSDWEKTKAALRALLAAKPRSGGR